MEDFQSPHIRRPLAAIIRTAAFKGNLTSYILRLKSLRVVSEFFFRRPLAAIIRTAAFKGNLKSYILRLKSLRVVSETFASLPLRRNALARPFRRMIAKLRCRNVWFTAGGRRCSPGG